MRDLKVPMDLPKMHYKEFPSSKNTPMAGKLHVHLWPSTPQAVFYISGGKDCCLRGEDLGKLIAWLKEEGFLG